MVFESLDREYARNEDWCGSEKAGDREKEAFMRQLIQKHNEQKEGFLKVRLSKFFSRQLSFFRQFVVPFLWKSVLTS